MRKADREALIERKREALRVIAEQNDSTSLRAVRALLDCFEEESMEDLVALTEPMQLHRAQGGVKALRLVRDALAPPAPKKDGDHKDGAYT